MADIAAEIAWMRSHAARQAVEDAADRAAHARTCRCCFHPEHVIEYGGDLSDPVVLYCRDPVCACGVPPCPGCGERVRPTASDEARVTECPFCRWQMRMALYA